MNRKFPAKLHVSLVLAVLLFSSIGPSQELRIHSLNQTDSSIGFAVTGQQSSYFIVHHAKSTDGPWSPVFMELGMDGVNAFTLAATNQSEYFRVEEVPRSNPKDTDGDGLDDVCELLYRPAFDPLVPQDPKRDYDQDGIPDIVECGNNWNPLNPNSPTPEEFGRKRGPVGPTIVGPIISSQFGDHVGDIGKVISNTSISRNGTSVFISVSPKPEGGTNYMIHRLKIQPDGTVQETILDQQLDTYGVMAFGPHIEINQYDEVLVRRVVVVPTPLANLLYSFLTRYDAFGNRVDLVTGGSLKLISEFSDIQRDYCMNNVGDFATTANDWDAGRVIASGTSEFLAKTPLSETTPFSPMQCSDAHTLVIRTGDANGKIRLFGMPDLGNKPIFAASPANGFTDLGKRPGISYDGKMMVFYANYSGSGAYPNLSPGPGIFALVHTNAITAANVDMARLVRIAGIAGNGWLDPGERWDDANTNGVVDLGEDLGRITGFVPDGQVTCANDGKVVFQSMTTAEEGTGTRAVKQQVRKRQNGSDRLQTDGGPDETSAESLSCVYLSSLVFPVPGPMSVLVRCGDTFADGETFAAISPNISIDRLSGTWLALVTQGRNGGERACLEYLLTFDIEGYKRGTINTPGAKVSKGSGEYGQETVMMENADSEDNTTQPDYATAAVDAASDDDLVKVVLRWPKDLKINDVKLELKHKGMEVDLTKTRDADKYKEVGNSRLNFYKPDGTKLTDADLKIDDLGNPGTGYLAQILSTGELTLFVEGAEKFGMVGNDPKSTSAAKKLGGAMLNLEVTHSGTTSRARLLVYRGGFLLFRQPSGQPGGIGTFELRDGKGRITDTQTDAGNLLLSWPARSGKAMGANYDVGDGNGHIPPGWRVVFERTDLTVAQKDSSSGSGRSKKIKQGGYVRWKQDDETDVARRYTKNYLYDASKDNDYGIGEPDAISFKFQTEVISPTSAANRSEIQIHPDGKKDGTAGCIGIQTFQGCKDVSKLLRRYHALKLKTELQ
jgi:hypothetical protein